MSAMLATIDDETERKLVADRLKHGMAYMRVLQDGRIEHVPIEQAPATHDRRRLSASCWSGADRG